MVAAALILSYLPGYEQNAALIYYGSYGFLFTCFIVNKTFLRPGYVFLLMMNGYVAAGSVGLWIDTKEVFDIFSFFSPEAYLVNFQVGLVAALGVALPLAWENTSNLTPCKEMPVPSVAEQWYGRVALFLTFPVIGANFLYAYQHRELFFESYFFAAADTSTTQLIMFVIYMDYLIMCLTLIYLVYEPKWNKSITFWSSVFLFTLFTFMTGARTQMVVHFFMIFWRYYSQHEIKIFEKWTFKLGGLVAGLSLMGAISRYRERSVDLLSAITDGYYNIIYEFGNCVFSSLYSVEEILNGDGPPVFWGLLDPILGLVPTFLVPGKKELLTFHAWVENLPGGYEEISPIGGFFLPGNLYLITGGSMIGVFIYFSLFSILMILAYRYLFQVEKVALMRGLMAVSLICISGLRYEYWVIVKLIIIFVWFSPLLFYYIGLFVFSSHQNNYGNNVKAARINL
jgi:oligosaccharide repeat unit polymerase